MYLLNPTYSLATVNVKSQFTFHYVSIKSVINFHVCRNFRYLHSTMYLLNLFVERIYSVYTQFTFHYVSIKSHFTIRTIFGSNLFTFHYVSIKSYLTSLLMLIINHLHSTMYLLNHCLSCLVCVSECRFTFHYVSIKSVAGTDHAAFVELFTFHYVSIKSIRHLSTCLNISLFTFHYVSIKSPFFLTYSSHLL